jgi:prevent-host-death family protein
LTFLTSKEIGIMTISAKELRRKPSQIIEQAAQGAEIIITLRGRKAARLIPFNVKVVSEPEIEDELFGLWKDREGTIDVGEYVRSLRKGSRCPTV